jgi:hypothetical protein
MTSKEFWGLVEEEKVRLIGEHRARAQRFRETGGASAWENQPETGNSLFIVSKPRQGSGEKPQVVEVGMRLAAQRVVEESHEVARPDQIAAFLKLQDDNAAIVRTMEEKMNAGPRAVVVRPAEVPRGKRP